jgi:hypothetical protein
MKDAAHIFLMKPSPRGSHQRTSPVFSVIFEILDSQEMSNRREMIRQRGTQEIMDKERV